MPETGFDQWVTRVVQESMPIFARTVHSVAGMASSEDRSLSDLAWAILEDPALTAHVLRLANSIYYNPGSKRISTVTRALMRLGAEKVREICLAIALVESVLSSLHKKKVALEVSRAFHAAVQARRIAARRGLFGPEEVFIAALLTRIGNIVFWCFSGEDGERLEGAIAAGEREDHAEIEILGFKLERLTLRLNQEWKLSNLLEDALRDKKGIDPRVRCIHLGCAVARECEKGWDSPQLDGVIKEASEFLRLSEDETVEILHESAMVAAEITQFYGATSSSRLIPLPEKVKPLPPLPLTEIKQEFPKPDQHIQLCSLRDLSTLVTYGKGDVNMVLSIVLEGIYRGIGMDKVVFALLTPDRQYLTGKHGLGFEDEGWARKLKIPLDPFEPNIFGHLLKQGRPIWVTAKPEDNIKVFLTKEIFQLTEGGPFFAAPVSIKSTLIGIVYADRNQSGRSLDEDSFENFTFFAQQANVSLGILAGSKSSF